MPHRTIVGMKESAKCLTCGGSGKITETITDAFYDTGNVSNWQGHDETRFCPDCNGTGIKIQHN